MKIPEDKAYFNRTACRWVYDSDTLEQQLAIDDQLSVVELMKKYTIAEKEIDLRQVVFSCMRLAREPKEKELARRMCGSRCLGVCSIVLPPSKSP